jgi:hypothetical protein
MAEIVCVHGIAQQLKGENSLAQVWVPALLDGLRRAGYQGEGPSIVSAFYGDFFRKPGTMAVQSQALAGPDTMDAIEEALIILWWQDACKTDANVVPPEAMTMLRTPLLVQRALNALSSSRFFSGMTQSLIRLFARQVYLYLHDPELRAAVRGRVGECISEDTRVIVGHSLGSVVAYEALCLNPGWQVRTFVSLGSPLGVPPIFERLNPSPTNGVGKWPAGLIRWVNVADRGDCVALRKDLSSCFGERVHDLLVNNEARAHDVRPYLSAAETGRAIAQGLVECPTNQ